MKTQREIQVLKQFYQLEKSKARYILFRGSTRSGKTIAIIQNLLIKLTQHNNIHIVVGMETLRQAKSTIIKDIDEWLNILNLYSKFNVNKSDFTYEYIPTGSIMRFLPCDDDGKWYGVKADIFWFNEATHINKNIFEQAEMRLPDRKDFHNFIVLDFNPTNPHSWVRELERYNDAETFVSTYQDNPFIGEKQRKLYESWKDTNYNKWLVFGCGEYGDVRGAVYTNWTTCDIFPLSDKIWYGIDFGFSNDATSLIKMTLQNGELFIDELIYETGLTNPDIVEYMRDFGLTRTDTIIADSAEPKSIEEIRRSGYNITAVKKGPNSILQGIDILQRYKINITKRSKNIIDEITNYTWMEDKKRGEFINKPVDDWNHALDAMRYIALEKLATKSNASRTLRRI